jgi:serine/threonine protein kinase
LHRRTNADIILTLPLSSPTDPPALYPKSSLPPPNLPAIKLSDFGLAKEVDPSDPILTTRCGSDSYAAPEIIMGKSYDGRETDSWACGVVLFALLVS